MTFGFTIYKFEKFLNEDVNFTIEWCFNVTEAHEVYTTPRRVFFNLPGSHIQLCDYMFTDEKPVEVKGLFDSFFI